MWQNPNGINMSDVKIKNRSSILNLVYQSGGTSRKEIANRLGLTPAAITLITTDLIQEGVLSEYTTAEPSNRKGRKEVILKINTYKYAAVGVYITRHKFRILCVDLDNTILFEDTVYTADCKKESELILNKLCDTLNTHLQNYDVLRTHRLIGLGVSVNGIVDTHSGVSVRSYNIWERNVPVRDYLTEKLDTPVLLTNNICSLAHGEYFLSHMEHADNMLFIKYGPGVGAARLVYENFLNISDFKAIQLGHIISDPNGAACVCGNPGCLETIASYDSIEAAIANVMSEDTAPFLFGLTRGVQENITMQHVISAYTKKDPAVTATIDRSIYYLSIAIKNAICMFDPQKVVLYGELFENPAFRQKIYTQLSRFTDTEKVNFSHYNLQLETLGPATTIIQHFFQNGGKL